MARTMKKFSAGGAQGRYDRRMADIEKDYAKAMARKTGKAAEVAEAKRQQRIADAKDDLAKRTGADRTATRAAERTAESNLTKTRKYGAPKSVTTEASVSEPKVATVSAPLKSGLSTPAKKPEVKKAPVKAAATTPKRMGDQGFAYKKKDMPTTGQGVPTHYRYVRGGSNSGAAADGTAAKRLENKGIKTGDLKTGNKGTGTNRVAAAADPKDKSSAASRARAGAALSYLNPFSYISNNEEYTKRQEAKYGKAKGGKVMKKMAKGGSIPPQPSAADRARSKAQMESLKRVKPTPAEIRALQSANRSEGRRYATGGVIKEMPSSKAMGSLGMAKGGKVKSGMAAKVGRALVKKSADTMGRALVGAGKSSSPFGVSKKGYTGTALRADKTKPSMARGGAAKMRSRDSYGGASFKKGGKTC